MFYAGKESADREFGGLGQLIGVLLALAGIVVGLGAGAIALVRFVKWAWGG